VATHEKEDLKLKVTSPQTNIFTKMSFWSAELQKCHYRLKMLTQWRENVGANMAMMLKSRDNDVEITWQLYLDLMINIQAPKFTSQIT